MGQHSTMHLKTTESFNGQDGKWVPARSNASGQMEIATLSGELTQFNRLAGGSIIKYKSITADDLTVSGACIFYGIKVLAAGTSVTVYDNTAASGPAVISGEATTAAGTIITPAGVGTGILMNNGIYVDLTLGTLLVLYVDAV